MARPAQALIDLEAIRHNYRQARRLAPGTRAFAIIKANAYGHGAVRVAQALAGEADGFGVACIEEALELRESGISSRIVLLEGIFTPDEMVQAGQAGFDLVVHTPEQLEWLLQARPARTLNVLLKIDTGMHRLGLAPAEVPSVFSRLQQCAHVGDITLMTHFARADEAGVDVTLQQISRFKTAIRGLEAPVSLANSAGILTWPQSHGNWIRPGLMLYGVTPMDDGSAQALLKPAMTLKSALIAVRELHPGEHVGYGGRFRCETTTRVGVVAMGYADGYPRHATDGTPVLLNGRRTRLIGRVSMDMLTIDLGGQEARVGDPVELWGRHIDAADVARHAATIPYTLFTGITRRVPLIYH
ncbi:MAG TPA: alanine racemase [Thiolinea sp.]|nr:alanine racemase [Thiolinea sp.]